MHHTMGTSTRRSILRSGLRSSLLLSLAAVSPLRTMLVQDVAAVKNSKKAASIAKRAQTMRELCEIGGGTATTDVRPGGTSVTCKGGTDDGKVCIIHSKGGRCFQTVTNPDLPNQPLEPDSPYANPGDLPDVPLEQDGGGVVLTSYGGNHDRATHRGKHRRRGRGKGRNA